MYINDIVRDIMLYMFDFLLPLEDFCDAHSCFSMEEKRILIKRVLFQKFARSIKE